MKIIRLIIIVLISFAAASCITSSVPVRITSDDCLVLIKTEIENPENLTLARTFKLSVSGFDAPFKVRNTADAFIAVKIRTDDVKIISVSSDVTSEGFRGDSTDVELNIPLPYEPGEVVAADFKFVQFYFTSSGRQSSEKSITVSTDFKIPSAEEKAELVKDVKSMEEYISWID